MSEINEKNWPQSARELLEARYQAFKDGNIDFIVETTHPETREQHDRKEIEAWANNSEWLGLEIEKEENESDYSWINFTVNYREKDKEETVEHEERALFRQHEGRWYYVDSTFPKAKTYRREEKKVGRNDPCTCGSGKKYKKCCGSQTS
ncbi:MAG: SEC-C domain-containing protein [Deltaproteobacteria bacterium]|nr:SEC-C domain-containing protein [Deltaproteobacteria bacterium]